VPSITRRAHATHHPHHPAATARHPLPALPAPGGDHRLPLLRRVEAAESQVVSRRPYQNDGPLIDVLRRALAREEKKIEWAQDEIRSIKYQLLELGVELPLQESEPNIVRAGA